MIRPAKFVDTPRIVELLGQMHQESRYRDVDEVDPKAAHRLISHAIHRHGHEHEGGAFVMVAVRDGTPASRHVVAVSVALLASYTLGCHSLRHLVGGHCDGLGAVDLDAGEEPVLQ